MTNDYDLTTKATEANCEALRAYNTARRNAARRGKDWLFEPHTWLWKWLDSGEWGNRGREGHQKCMSRFGDQGSYSYGNTFIQTTAANIAQGNTGRKATYRRVNCERCGMRVSSNALHQHAKKCAK